VVKWRGQHSHALLSAARRRRLSGASTSAIAPPDRCGEFAWGEQIERAEEERREQQMQNPLEPLLVRLLREFRCDGG
jgi:hypothetical protein